MPQATVMIVDDEANMLRTVESILRAEGFQVVAAASGRAALEKLATQPVQVILTDARMPAVDGFELLAETRQRYPHIPVVMMTAYATPKLAVQAIKGGAADYIAKPFDPEELIHVVRTVLRDELLEDENRHLRGLLGRRYRLQDLLGDSPVMREVRDLIQVTAPTEATVLLVGESGTGKEMAASALHLGSPRAEQPFIGINCAAIPENLLESELFGHERGAFTGAVRQRIGRFEEADGGTLFLDEIGDMGPQLQSKLLRVLEEKQFQRVGGNERIQVNVRVLAATNQNLKEALATGRFRQDLYHRLNVVQIRFPPLREREGDIELLANHFLHQFSEAMGKRITGFTDAARRLMLAYHWPGNVRELRNAVERAVIVETSDQIRAQSLPTSVGESPPATGGAELPANLEEAVADYERGLIERALRLHRGKINETAAALGITRHALRYRMQKLGMDVDAVFEKV